MPLKHEKPNPALLARLSAVANRAASLQEILRGENMLPTDFPEEQLSTYLGMMENLPNGTAEGCRIPLEQMRNELPRISAENIHDSETLKVKYASLSEDDLPPLQPDGNLDTALDLVISAVTKAYDEYRRQAADASEDEEIDSEMRAIPQEIEAEPLLLEIEAVNERILVDYNEANDILPENNNASDNYKRSLKDAENANLTAEGFLKGNRIVRRWFRKSITALKKSAPAIETTGKVLKNSGVPTAGISLLVGLSVPETALTVVMLKQLGENIENFANYLDAKDFGTGTSLHPLPPIPDIDRALQESARYEAQELLRAGKVIPPEIGEHVRALGTFIRHTSVSNFTLLENCPYLTDAYFQGSKALDLTPLAKLKYLKYLYLSNTQAKDLTPLSELTGLKSLSLIHTEVTKLAPLSHLTELTHLSLDNTKVTELAALSQLIGLKTLSLNRTQVKQLAALSHLTALETLELNNTQVTELAPLRGLMNLKYVGARNLDITDWTPVKHVKNVIGRPD